MSEAIAAGFFFSSFAKVNARVEARSPMEDSGGTSIESRTISPVVFAAFANIFTTICFAESHGLLSVTLVNTVFSSLYPSHS